MILSVLAGAAVGGVIAHVKFRKPAGGVVLGAACALLLAFLFGPSPASVVAVVNPEDFHQQVLSSDRPVLVDFYADWCSPCRKLSPIIDELAVEYDGRIKVVKIDVQTSRLLAREYNVRGIPAVFIFVDGKPVERINGLHPKADYVSAIEAILKR